MKYFWYVFIMFLFSFHSLLSQTLTVSPTNIETGHENTSVSITISSNTSWGMYGYPSWIHPQTVWGSGDKTVYFDIDENAYMLSRTDNTILYWTDSYGNYLADTLITFTQAAHSIGLADSIVYIDADENSSAELSIVSDSYWEVSDVPEWLIVENNYSRGSANIQFTAHQNPRISTREAYILVHRLTADSVFVTGKVAVYQSGSSVGISNDNILLSNNAGSSEDIMILTDKSWTITGLPDWLSVSKTSGTGSDMITISAQKNAEIYSRNVTFNIELADGEVYRISVTQNPSLPRLQISQSHINFGSDYNLNSTISVLSNTYWGIGQIPDWIINQSVFAFGDTSFSVSATPNPYMVERNATLLPYWLDKDMNYAGHYELLVTQSANTEGLSDSVLNIGYEHGSTASFSVQTNSVWEIIEVPDWLSFDHTRGTGNASITVTAQENPYSGVRTARFIVKREYQNTFVEGIVTVHQTAGVQGVSDSIVSIGSAAGSTVDFSILYPDSYTIQINDSWLSLDKNSGIGNTTIRVTAQENPEIYSRISVLEIQYQNSQTQYVKVVQQASEPLFLNSPERLVFNENGGVQQFIVESNTYWGLSDLPEWIREDSVFEKGDTTIVFTAEVNANQHSRVDSVLCYWLKANGETSYKWLLFWQIGNQNVRSYTYNLSEGWNLISCNLIMSDNSIETVFSPILENLSAIKNNTGFYKPNIAAELNSLQEINVEEGYLIKLSQPVSFTLSGVAPDYSYTEFSNLLSNGWNLTGFPFQTADNITTIFDNENLIIKNFDGFYESGSNQNSLFEMVPGQGYFIYKQ
ncbi:MAG: BACON domain-containing protein [Bacteroidota bacterium]